MLGGAPGCIGGRRPGVGCLQSWKLHRGCRRFKRSFPGALFFGGYAAMASLWNSLRSEVMGTVDEFRQKGAIGALRDAALDTKDMASDAGSWLWGNVKSLVDDAQDSAVLCFDGVPPRGATAPLQFHDGRVVEAMVMEVDGVSDPPRAQVKVEGIEQPLLVLVRPASEVVQGDQGLLASIKQEWDSTVQDFREKGAVGALKDATMDAVDLVGTTAGKAVSVIGNTAGKAVDGARSLIDTEPEVQDAQSETQRGSVMQLVDGLKHEIKETVQDFREKGAVATFKDAALDAVDLVGTTATTAVNGAKTVAAPILEDFWAKPETQGDAQPASSSSPPEASSPAAASPAPAAPAAVSPTEPAVSPAAAASTAAASPAKGGYSASKAEEEDGKRKSLVSMRRGMFEKKEEPKEEPKEVKKEEEEEVID